jgi:hypothetical protein
MASGTLDINLSSGQEKYQSGLGTFQLKRGAKTAPVFEQSVLPDRNFVGGVISLNASLTGIKKDTVLAGMLKSAANASLGIVAGMVQTASVAGPAAGPAGGPTQLLAEAGGELISGIRTVLSDTAPKREPLFDFSGLGFSVQPTSLTGPESFFLFHRGAQLEETKLTIRPSGNLLLPYYGAGPLDDGAWLLLRFRRSDEYSGVRDWFPRARSLRGNLSALVSDVQNDIITKADALKRLKPSVSGDPTLYDQFANLRGVILNDGVLSEREAGLYVGQLQAFFVAARKAIAEHQSAVLEDLTDQLRLSLLKGERLKGQIGTVFANEARSLSEARREARGESPVKMSNKEVFESMKYLPGSIERLSL